MNLTKQQVSTKLQTAKTIDALKLDADENTQVLIRKLDEKVRQAKMKLQRNEDVTVVFLSWAMESVSDVEHKKGIYHIGFFIKKIPEQK